MPEDPAALPPLDDSLEPEEKKKKRGARPKGKGRGKAKTKTKAARKARGRSRSPSPAGDFGGAGAGALDMGEPDTEDRDRFEDENEEEHDIDDDDNEEEELKTPKKQSRKDEPNPAGPPLTRDAIVQHRAELLYYSTGRNKKEKKKCIGCRKPISPGTLRVYFPNQGCRHLHKCFHAGLGHGLYYTASALNNFDIIKPNDRDRVVKRLKEMHRDTSELRSASGKVVHGWGETDYCDYKRWAGLMDVQVVPVNQP